mgnify:CR=1 FL=1
MALHVLITSHTPSKKVITYSWYFTRYFNDFDLFVFEFELLAKIIFVSIAGSTSANVIVCVIIKIPILELCITRRSRRDAARVSLFSLVSARRCTLR